MSRLALAVLAFLAVSIVSAVPAQAVLITVNFTITGFGSGSFSYDSSIVPSGGGTLGNPLFTGTTDYSTDVSFTYNGDVFNGSNSGANTLIFNSSGVLTGWYLAGDLGGMNGFMVPGPDFFIIAGNTQFGGEGFAYASAQDTSAPFNVVDVTWTTTTGAAPTPESASLTLIGIALLGIVGTRRTLRQS